MRTKRILMSAALAIAAMFATTATATAIATDTTTTTAGASTADYPTAEEFERQCNEGCLLFVSDGSTDYETAALAYSLKNSGGQGIDEYLSNLSAERRAAAQEKLTALKQSPEALDDVAILGSAGDEEHGLAADSSVLAGSLQIERFDVQFGFCSETCTTLQVVDFEMWLDATFYPELVLSGDIRSASDFFIPEMSCTLMHELPVLPDTVMHEFTNCAPMLFPDVWKPIYEQTWTQSYSPNSVYYVDYYARVIPRPDINAEFAGHWHEHRYSIDGSGRFSWSF